MTVLYISKDDVLTANVHAVYSGEKVQSIDEPLAYEVDEITISSCTNQWTTGFGKLTPLALAEKLAANYQGDKRALKHLYLLTCEGGLLIHGQPSLAKQLVQILFKKGFTELAIHAPTPPCDVVSEDMILEVTCISGGFFAKGDMLVTITYSLEAYRIDRAVTFLEKIRPITGCIAFFSPQFANHQYFLSSFVDDNMHLKRINVLRIPGEKYKDILQSPLYTFTAHTDPMPYSLAYGVAVSSIYYYARYSCRVASSRALELIKQHANSDVTSLIELLENESDFYSSDEESSLALELIKQHANSDFTSLIELLKNESDFYSSDLKTKSYSGFLAQIAHDLRVSKDLYIRPPTALPKHIESILNDVERKMQLGGIRPLYSASTAQLIYQLQDYINQRIIQSEYCSVSFLHGFTAIVEWVSNALSYILARHQSKTVKINAAERLIEKLQGNSQEEFSADEKNALRNGRLGSIIDYSHPSLTSALI